MKNLGLYIHIPWCIKKCPYCDFNSHAVKDELPEQIYIDTLLKDLTEDLRMLNAPGTVTSIFIGGGTPSLFSAKIFDRLLTELAKLIPLQENLEITLEANPGTFESQKFAEYRAIGINRLSIGIQSFNNQHLKKLGRIHTAEEGLKAVEIAHQAGFENLNLDLMFGLPSQTPEQMLKDVQTAINLNPSHLSFYQLTLEPNTFFYKFPPVLPKDEEIFTAQLQCQQLLEEKGYLQYEISAYAKNMAFCEHNLNYWRFGDYLGVGAGAHGKLSISTPNKILRTTKSKSPDHYMQQYDATSNIILQGELPLEFLMNQLRLKAGFNIQHYQSVTGLAIDTLEPALSTCVTQKLLIKQGKQYLCSEKGWRFVDHILEKFID